MNLFVKKFFIVSLIVGMLFFSVLVYHIASQRPIDNQTVQISRIDFEQPFDSLGAKNIESVLKSIPGVKSDVIVVRNVVVYYHDKKIATSKQVYDQLMTMGRYKAVRFVVPEKFATQAVCPVMDESSFKFRFSRFIQRIFN